MYIRKEKGITLIALVITIVVLIILAGISINLILGENGLFLKAQKAAQNYKDEAEKEEAKVGDLGAVIDNIVSNSEETLNGSWSQKNKVNKPKLSQTGLSPVTIDSNGICRTPKIENDDWYSYNGKNNNWANAITKDGSMWVWIPRFAYKITYNDESNKSKGGTIDVVFLQDISNKDYNGQDVTLETYVDEKGSKGAYIVHPAFEDGTENNFANGEWNTKIPGFWISKFEAGYVGMAGDESTAVDSNITYSTIYSRYQKENNTIDEDMEYNYYGKRNLETKIKYPIFQANRPSMNFISIGDAYDLCRDLQNATNVYGLNNVDSHLPKNSEWGAVAYLTDSKYGRSGKVVIGNNVSLNGENTIYAVTGYSGKEINEAKVITTLSNIENRKQEGSWITPQGQMASSTGNIYGIYDLSGGLWEYTAGYIEIEEKIENYAKNFKNQNNQYINKYEGSSSETKENFNEEKNQSRLGEAIWETYNINSARSWHNAVSLMVRDTGPFFNRGGSCETPGYYEDVFSFSRTAGYCSLEVGFRAVLIP